MARTLTDAEIAELAFEERLELVERLWNSIELDRLPLPEWHKRALDEALEEYERNPNEGRPWGRDSRGAVRRRDAKAPPLTP